MSKADEVEDNRDEALEGTANEAMNINEEKPAKDLLPPSPPPPPPLPASIQRCETSESFLSSSIPKHVGFGMSFPSSLASSFVTYASDIEDINILDLELVDDDTTLGYSQDMKTTQPSSNEMVTSKLGGEEDDSFQHGHNAHHERVDFSPTPPMRGNSAYSIDPASIAKQPYIFLNQNQPTTTQNQNSYNPYNSLNSSIPSMWEESWATYGTTADNNHHIVDIMHDVVEEGKQANMSMGLPNTTTTIMNQGLKVPQRKSSIGRAPNSPKRASSRTSQYSGFSNMSKSTLDPTAMRRVSRMERISRLKRKSLHQNSQTSSPVSTISKSIHSMDSFQSAGAANNNNNARMESSSLPSNSSQNSAIPQRRETKILPWDEEAEAEPTTFLQHSESQLSLTSSEEEDDSSDFGSDHIPRRGDTSVTSLSLYEAEAAALRLDRAMNDVPLAAPLRRTSTFGSATLDPSAVVERDDEHDLESDDKHSFPITSIHMPRDMIWDDAPPPVSSIHVPPDTSANDSIPALPFRQRSIGEGEIQRKVGRLQQNRVAVSEEETKGRGPNQREPSAAEDVMPAMPKRQSTITSVEARRKSRNESDQNERSVNEENNTLNDNSLAPQQPELFATQDAPHAPTRQLSFSSRLLNTMEAERLFNGPSVDEDMQTRGKQIPARHHGHHSSNHAHESCPICSGTSHDHEFAMGGSIASNATTAKRSGSGDKRDPERMPPCRHFTKGSSLRSAAASLQKRVSDSSTSAASHAQTKPEQSVGLGDNRALRSQVDEKRNLQEHAATGPMMAIQSDVFDKDTTLQGVDKELGGLNLGSSSDTGTPVNAQSADSGGSKSSADAEPINTLAGGDNQSISSAWTSVSKEFEALKAINNATVAGLETQLKILEKDQTELYRHDSAEDLSISSKMACSTEGGSGSSNLE